MFFFFFFNQLSYQEPLLDSSYTLLFKSVFSSPKNVETVVYGVHTC